MSWRTIYISSQCHLSYKNNQLIIRNDEVKTIHLSEINTLIIDSSASSISTYLLAELIKNKIKVILCDDKHNPSSELVPYYLAFNTSKMVNKETSWNLDNCDLLWQEIVKNKIYYQAKHLEDLKMVDKSNQLFTYINQVEIADATNREGHAAKVYFNALFGLDFTRTEDNDINSALNYGYTILLSMFNREIVNCGYITQIGIHHKGETNPFNLSCDLMEPFRPIVDRIVYENMDLEFDKSYKFKLIEIMNTKYLYQGQSTYLTYMVNSYVKKTLDNLNQGKIDKSLFEYGNG